jgi:hypothetical protein
MSKQWTLTGFGAFVEKPPPTRPPRPADQMRRPLSTPGGSQPGCAERNVSPGWIVQVRACERYVSCSAWKWTTGTSGNGAAQFPAMAVPAAARTAASTRRAPA